MQRCGQEFDPHWLGQEVIHSRSQAGLAVLGAAGDGAFACRAQLGLDNFAPRDLGGEVAVELPGLFVGGAQRSDERGACRRSSLPRPNSGRSRH